MVRSTQNIHHWSSSALKTRPLCHILAEPDSERKEVVE
jgi:hypothetical protein